jgi:DNA-directed RNA polymerase subunit beta'
VKVKPGETLAKISREVYKTRDITGGLPRVAELFEARRPKDPAVITEIDGDVRFGDIKRGKREVIITRIPDPSGPTRSRSESTCACTRGTRCGRETASRKVPINPHDILRIKGPRAVQEYLLNEIQEVYRLQGVKINDKHIGVIVRQMLQKVRITDPGDTSSSRASTWTGWSSAR